MGSPQRFDSPLAAQLGATVGFDEDCLFGFSQHIYFQPVPLKVTGTFWFLFKDHSEFITIKSFGIDQLIACRVFNFITAANLFNNK